MMVARQTPAPFAEGVTVSCTTSVSVPAVTPLTSIHATSSRGVVRPPAGLNNCVVPSRSPSSIIEAPDGSETATVW